MNLRLDRRRVAALMRVARTDDGRVLLELLEDALGRTKDMLVTSGPDAIGRLQGRAQALDDLLEAFTQAPDLLKKLEEK